MSNDWENFKKLFEYTEPQYIDVNKTYDKLYLELWWKTLSDVWKAYFSSVVGFNGSPAIDDLNKAHNIDSIHCHQLFESLDPIINFHNLIKVYITKTRIKTIEPLRNMTSLCKLYGGGSKVREIDAVVTLTNLEQIGFQNTEVITIEPLSSIQTLQIISFNNTRVCDLKPVSNLKNLTHLYFNNTLVADIEPLFTLEKVRTLSIENTKVQKSQVEKFKQVNPSCEIIWS